MYFSSFQTSTPTSEGLTALASYVLACQTFLFFATMQFMLQLFLLRLQLSQEERNRGVKVRISGQAVCKGAKETTARGASFFTSPVLRHQIDKVSFVAFAIAFGVYNGVYVYQLSKERPGKVNAESESDYVG